MKLRPFSEHPRGLFVSVDGPSGAGKSTIVDHQAQLLVAAGEEVHITAEPSNGPIGALCRELTETVEVAAQLWIERPQGRLPVDALSSQNPASPAVMTGFRRESSGRGGGI